MRETLASSAGCGMCGYDAAVDGAPAPCPRCAVVGVGRFCGACGADRQSGRVARRAMRSLFAPIAEYAEHARSLIRPSHLIDEIREGHFTLVELLGFWVAAILIGSLVMTLLPIKPAEGEHFAPPILTEAAQAIAVMLVVTLVYSPLHLILRVGRRDVSAREFLMVMLAIMALVLPWLALFEGLVVRLRLPGDASTWGWIVLLPVMAAAMARLYRRSAVMVGSVVIGYFAILLMVALALIGIVAVATHRPIESLMAAPSAEHR